ncbi:hypothetical protein Hthe01_20790 [Hydrogenophilus thermoluteolus]|nr:hypothetical protein [Hydrogenophilus thermoluteolus]GLW61730.1 hypothetical protein Hthe01_20790 [Hydrogenophilus thermoluteolus]
MRSKHPGSAIENIYQIPSLLSGCEPAASSLSSEQKGRYLNEGLIFQKEGFGGRVIVHDFYELELQ